MEQHTDSKLGKTVHHDFILSPCLLTYAEYKVNAGLDESQAGIKIRGELKSLLRRMKKES